MDAPLGMPDDDGAGAGVLEHFGRKVTGEGPRRLAVTVLRADLQRGAPRGGGKARQERRGRTHHDLDERCELASTLNDSGKFRLRAR